MLHFASLTLASISGCLLHLLFFIRGEYHTHTPKIVWFYSVLSLGLLVYQRNVSSSTRYVLDTVLIICSHILGLLGSMVMYRLLFHRLRSFPGPPVAKVTKLWHVVKVLNRQNHTFLEKVHLRYGTFVRTGPSELTIFTPEVFAAISGPGTPCIKAVWYDMLYPLVALNSIREREGYATRRRMWDQSFKTTVLRRDVPTILGYVSKLRESIEGLEGKPIVINEWFSRSMFAIMSDLAFAKKAETLEDESIDRTVNMIQSGMNVLGFVSPAPWLAQLLFSVPGMAYSWNQALKWTSSNMSQRLEKSGESKRDVSAWLIEAASNNDGSVNTNDLYGDAFAVIVAGSHSTAATLTFLFYELARKLDVQEKVRLELSTLTIPFDVEALNDLPYLNACIEETLRLYPVLLTAGARQTKETGITVAGRYIPPWTTIVAPRYSISRLESCFERAKEFIPERFTTKPEMVKNARANNPFSIGRHTCPGRSLGLIEIRITVALLLSRFQVCLAPGNGNETRILDDMKDNFTTHPGRLDLVFKQL